MPADTAQTTECPPTGDLNRLVQGEVGEARKAALEDHVGACPGCQGRLDALAGGDPKALAADLRECTHDAPPSDSAYYPALAVVEAEVRASFAGLNGAADGQPVGELKLDFLRPPRVPGRLGLLGDFDIVRVVGRGGMGVVLEAFDPSLQREVAIKVIDPQLAGNATARQRFCREARAAAAVTHANLVAVHQVDEDEESGLPYLVMQLVNGESLSRRLKRVGKLPPREVAHLGMQAATGLAAAHAKDLIHRDIKPGNILLEDVRADPAPPGPAGPAHGGATTADAVPVREKFRVKLTDFGLARWAEDVKLTRTGFVAGSPLYMAPEQAQGGEVDARSDLFSLGSVLYEAATGAPPFEGKTPLAVLRRVADETPRPLREVDPAFPDGLSDIIARLLAKNPADRFQTAAEVAQAFAGELARADDLSPLDVPAEVCAVASRSATTRVRRHVCWKGVALRVLPWVGGLLLGGLSVGLVGPLLGPAPAPDAPPPAAADPGPAPRVVLAAESGPVWAVAFLGPHELVAGYEDGWVKIWDLRMGTVAKTLEPRQGGNVWSADVSADGKYLVTPCDDSQVTVWRLETYKVYREFTQPTSTKAAVFSPDSNLLATGDRNATVRIWNLDAQIPIELRGHAGTVHALAYSPDGSRLASAGSDGTAKVWDLRDLDWGRLESPGKPLQLGEHRGPVYGVAFSPDGERIATTGWDGTVRLWDAGNGKLLLTIKAHDGDAWSVAFGNGGKWVASAGQDAVKVWDVDTGKEVFAYRSTGRAFHVVRFARDGTTLAAGGRDGAVKVWDLPK